MLGRGCEGGSKECGQCYNVQHGLVVFCDILFENLITVTVEGSRSSYACDFILKIYIPFRIICGGGNYFGISIFITSHSVVIHGKQS